MLHPWCWDNVVSCVILLVRQREKSRNRPPSPPPLPPLHRVLVGDKDSGPIEFEFETLGNHSGRRVRQRRATAMVRQREEGEEEGGAAASADGDGHHVATRKAAEQAEQFDSRVAVCKPVSSHDP